MSRMMVETIVACNLVCLMKVCM